MHGPGTRRTFSRLNKREGVVAVRIIRFGRFSRRSFLGLMGAVVGAVSLGLIQGTTSDAKGKSLSPFFDDGTGFGE